MNPKIVLYNAPVWSCCKGPLTRYRLDHFRVERVVIDRMTRQASTFELILPPQPEDVPSFHWLRNAIRLEILSGNLSPGSRLPASRDLARQYHLSRGTILAAIDELQAEGYLEARRG